VAGTAIAISVATGNFLLAAVLAFVGVLVFAPSAHLLMYLARCLRIDDELVAASTYYRRRLEVPRKDVRIAEFTIHGEWGGPRRDALLIRSREGRSQIVVTNAIEEFEHLYEQLRAAIDPETIEKLSWRERLLWTGWI
jgi:hypothetical protein